jgi:hypothetical protein
MCSALCLQKRSEPQTGSSMLKSLGRRSSKQQAPRSSMLHDFATHMTEMFIGCGHNTPPTPSLSNGDCDTKLSVSGSFVERPHATDACSCLTARYRRNCYCCITSPPQQLFPEARFRCHHNPPCEIAAWYGPEFLVGMKTCPQLSTKIRLLAVRKSDRVGLYYGIRDQT